MKRKSLALIAAALAGWASLMPARAVPPTVTIPASGGLPAYTGKAVAYDVAAWSDLWFYSNPIFVEVSGSTMVAGIK